MKMIRYLLLTSIFINSASAQQNTVKQSIIGRKYFHIDELSEFKGYKEQEGKMMQPTEAHFGLSEISNKVNTIITFDKVSPTKKSVTYTLLDTIVVGKLGDKQIMVMGSCKLNNKYDNEIIALVRYQAKEHYTTILKAWRANKKTGKFQKIANKGINCIDENYSEED